jgi:hypothetical protein
VALAQKLATGWRCVLRAARTDPRSPVLGSYIVASHSCAAASSRSAWFVITVIAMARLPLSIVFDRTAAFRVINRHGHISEQRLSPQGVALVVKRRAKAVGVNKKTVAAHSLHAGFATQAFGQGVPESP